MAKITAPEIFQAKWEEYIPQMSQEELSKYINETSPHHPNENMAWLYDRLLIELAGRKAMDIIPDLSGVDIMNRISKIARVVQILCFVILIVSLPMGLLILFKDTLLRQSDVKTECLKNRSAGDE